MCGTAFWPLPRICPSIEVPKIVSPGVHQIVSFGPAVPDRQRSGWRTTTRRKRMSRRTCHARFDRRAIARRRGSRSAWSNARLASRRKSRQSGRDRPDRTCNPQEPALSCRRCHDQDRGQSAMARKKGAKQVHCAAALRIKPCSMSRDMAKFDQVHAASSSIRVDAKQADEKTMQRLLAPCVELSTATSEQDLPAASCHAPNRRRGSSTH